jgi:hypothetical protein
VDGQEQQKVPSWTAFHTYWKTNFCHVVIPGSREDVCGECYIYANRHRYAVTKKEDDALLSSDDEDVQLADMVAGEKMVEDAARHVVEAQEQRELYRKKKKEAIDTLQEPPEARVLCFVADYAQNMNTTLQANNLERHTTMLQ